MEDIPGIHGVCGTQEEWLGSRRGSACRGTGWRLCWCNGCRGDWLRSGPSSGRRRWSNWCRGWIHWRLSWDWDWIIHRCRCRSGGVADGRIISVSKTLHPITTTVGSASGPSAASARIITAALPTLLARVSLKGSIREPDHGWIPGAVFACVFARAAPIRITIQVFLGTTAFLGVCLVHRQQEKNVRS